MAQPTRQLVDELRTCSRDLDLLIQDVELGRPGHPQHDRRVAEAERIAGALRDAVRSPSSKRAVNPPRFLADGIAGW